MGGRSRAQHAVVLSAGALLVVAFIIGVWPVSAAVVGDRSYACGSGVSHSFHQWRMDSNVLQAAQAGSEDSALRYPDLVCPNKVYGRRDLAFVLGVCGLLVGVGGLALLEPARHGSAKSKRAPPAQA